MVSISLDRVSVSLPVFGPNALSLRSRVGNLLGGKTPSKQVEVVKALRDLSIELKEGDRVGLRGPNGAGKSTFLRLVGGVYQPTGGAIKISGTRRCLFGLASGMEMEATGWENIRIGARKIGVPKNEIEAVCEDVAEFCQLGDSLERPIRTYSQGMLLRLNFGVMTSKPADIILIDEVIGVGDSKFMERANARMVDFAEQAKILLLASHSNEVIEMFCNQVFTFEKGRIAKRISWSTSDTDNDESGSSPEDFVERSHQSFSDALSDISATAHSSVDPKVSNLVDDYADDPFSVEFHRQLGAHYEEKDLKLSQWLQEKNIEALRFLESKEDGAKEPIEPPPSSELPIDFRFTRGAVESLVELLAERKSSDGVIVSLNSPWYHFVHHAAGKRLLTLHEDLNGISRLDHLPKTDGIQCIAIIGPVSDVTHEEYVELIKETFRRNIPYVAIWTKWLGEEAITNAEQKIGTYFNPALARTRFLTAKEATEIGDANQLSVEVFPEGRYLQAVSERLSVSPMPESNPKKLISLIGEFFEEAYSLEGSLNWPHGYWVIFQKDTEDRT